MSAINDVVRVPRYQLDLWRSMTTLAKDAAQLEGAPETFGFLVTLAGYLSDAAMVADADNAADDRWEQDYAATHPSTTTEGRWERGNWSVAHLRREGR